MHPLTLTLSPLSGGKGIGGNGRAGFGDARIRREN
jgi:hypothetical protein